MATRSRRTNLAEVVRKADPDWQRDKTREPEYDYTPGRVFTGKTAERGPYAEGAVDE